MAANCAACFDACIYHCFTVCVSLHHRDLIPDTTVLIVQCTQSIHSLYSSNRCTGGGLLGRCIANAESAVHGSMDTVKLRYNAA